MVMVILDKIPLELWKQVLQILPSIFWLIFIVLIFILFYRPIRYELLPNLGSFSAMGVKLTFVRDSMTAASTLREAKLGVGVSPEHKERVLRRIEKHLDILSGAMILWVDDNPESNINERRIFGHLKVGVDIAKSTSEADKMLDYVDYDVLISDIQRNGDPDAGMRFLRKLYNSEKIKNENKTTPVIFYVEVLDSEKGVPVNAFGITNRPDELFHLTMDALERKKY